MDDKSGGDEEPARGPEQDKCQPSHPERDVPIVDWEIPSLRKRIPRDLQEFIGVASPVVRVSLPIDRKQRRKHPEEVDRYEQLTREINRWEFVRRQVLGEGDGSSLQRWQVVWYVEEERVRWPMLAVLELRRDGILTLRSVHRRQQAWGPEFEERAGTVKREHEG